MEKLLSADLPERVDILKCEGLACRLAIKNGSLQILKALVNYYEQGLLEMGLVEGTTDYNIGRYKLKQVVDNALKSYDASKEMELFLTSRYLLILEIHEDYMFSPVLFSPRDAGEFKNADKSGLSSERATPVLSC
ncbi:MAG: hypothetical protein JKY54_07945 [Flavobacteriales bacterium]|nr:hypothetical protein [Flavobacteriales bacterium]